MANKEKNPIKRRRHSSLLITSVILILSILISSGVVGCGPSTEDLAAVDYRPLPGDELDELDMIIVTTADPLHDVEFGEESWKHEGAIVDLVGKFIKSLPTE